ncbi:unnamed protein product, partial [Mesorhabditis spiculigera]
MGDVRYLRGVRAKDLLIGITSIEPEAEFRRIFGFLLRRISDWLHGKADIDKIQICFGEEEAGAEKLFNSLVDKVAVALTTEIGWIDRTYEGMELILRASDGQALMVFWDEPDGYFYLIRCEYNFRRGRCLGSHQRNEESVRRICRLMSLSTQLRERNAELAENAREKLKNECIKFTEYNKGATTVDLMMDWIWRPKGQRRSPWGLIDDFILHDNVNRVDFAVLHAYRFVRAFGERDHLKPTQFIHDNFALEVKKEPEESVEFLESDMVCSLEMLHIELNVQGQGLIFYWDEKNRSVCLIGCEYNFRRGRCLGSYERNGKALARISALMAKSQLLLKRNPGRAVETKEKLRDECIKFNHYNKGATKMDLMTDAIWRPRSQRRFPWALFVKGLHQIFRSPIYPLDSSLNHAYEFTKAFETRDVADVSSLSSRLSTQNPKLAADAKEKLKEECIKFNEYNKGATEMDLLVDSIWRPKRQRRSVWGSFNGNVLPTDKYPVDPSIRHAYKFTKAFETTGVLPEIDEFKPADGKEIEDWKQRFPEFAF